MKEILTEAQAQLFQAEKAYEALADGHPQKTAAKKLLEVAQHNCEFVIKARGVHNVGYALDLLDKASENTAKVISIAGESEAKPASPGASP